MYIQVKDFGGKDRGLKFNQISLEAYSKTIATNLNLDSIDTSCIYATFYCGLVGCSTVKREEVDYTYEDVTEWVDKLYEEGRTEVIKDVCAKWSETFAYKDWLDKIQKKTKELQPEENKKKVKVKLKNTGLKSTSSHSVL